MKNRIPATFPRWLVCMLLLGVQLLLGACSVGPPSREPPAVFDLGPVRAAVAPSSRPRFALSLPAVTAPAWLDGTQISYRLAYADSARPQAYAQSRWAAPPSALLTQRLRTRFAVAMDVVTGQAAARAEYALHVELDDFSQLFAAPERSVAVLSARALLVHVSSRRLIAQRTFSMEQPAAPNATGATSALAQAGDAIIENMVGWTLQQLQQLHKEGK